MPLSTFHSCVLRYEGRELYFYTLDDNKQQLLKELKLYNEKRQINMNVFAVDTSSRLSSIQKKFENANVNVNFEKIPFLNDFEKLNDEIDDFVVAINAIKEVLFKKYFFYCL